MKAKNNIFFDESFYQKLISKIYTTNNKILMKTMLLCIFLSISFVFISEKSGWLKIEWKMVFIPALLVLQIIIIGTALKNRYKKH
jgi:hypothetical protein